MQFSAPEIMPPKEEEEEIPEPVEQSEESFNNVNMTEDSIPLLHEDSLLPKKEPLEMLAKAGMVFTVRNVLVRMYVSHHQRVGYSVYW